MKLVEELKHQKERLFYHEMIDHFSLNDIKFRDNLQDEIRKLKEDLLSCRKSLDELRDIAESEETKKICDEEIAEIDLVLEEK